MQEIARLLLVFRMFYVEKVCWKKGGKCVDVGLQEFITIFQQIYCLHQLKSIHFPNQKIFKINKIHIFINIFLHI